MYRRLGFLILLLFLFCDCADNQGVDKKMSIAESLIDYRPDSSLVLLESIRSENLSSRRQRARYSLLYSKALDKNYIDIACDSIIRPARAYYGKQENKEAMMTWYYDGIVHKNAGEWLQAMFSLDQSRHLAEKIQDYHYLGLVHRSMAEVLYQGIDLEGAISSYAEAVVAFERAGEDVYADYSRLSLALSYNNALRYEEEKVILKELMQKDSLSAGLRSQVYRAYASCCLSSNGLLEYSLKEDVALSGR